MRKSLSFREIKYHAKKLEKSKTPAEAKPLIDDLDQDASVLSVGVLARYGLTHPNEDISKEATKIMNRLGDSLIAGMSVYPFKKDFLSNILENAPPKDRKEIKAFARSAVPALVKALKNEDDDVASISAWALGDIKDKRAVKPLIEDGLGHNGVYAVGWSSWALGELGDERAIDQLIKHGLGNKKKGTVESAAKAIGKIGGKKTGSKLIKCLETGGGLAKKGSAIALGLICDHKAVKSLVKYGLKHENKWIAKEAAKSLGEIGGEEATSALFKYGMTHKEQDVNIHSAYALGHISGKKTIDKLIKGLESDDARTVAWNALALGETENKRALPHLMKLTGHEERHTNWLVKEAIKKIQEANHA